MKEKEIGALLVGMFLGIVILAGLQLIRTGNWKFNPVIQKQIVKQQCGKYNEITGNFEIKNLLIKEKQ